MQTWVLHAIVSMIFAGFTSVLAKYGIQSVSADVGLGIRPTDLPGTIVLIWK